MFSSIVSYVSCSPICQFLGLSCRLRPIFNLGYYWYVIFLLSGCREREQKHWSSGAWAQQALASSGRERGWEVCDTDWGGEGQGRERQEKGRRRLLFCVVLNSGSAVGTERRRGCVVVILVVHVWQTMREKKRFLVSLQREKFFILLGIWVVDFFFFCNVLS